MDHWEEGINIEPCNAQSLLTVVLNHLKKDWPHLLPAFNELQNGSRPQPISFVWDCGPFEIVRWLPLTNQRRPKMDLKSYPVLLCCIVFLSFISLWLCDSHTFLYTHSLFSSFPISHLFCSLHHVSVTHYITQPWGS